MKNSEFEHCRCSHCCPDAEYPYSSWKEPHRIFAEEEKKAPTDRLDIGDEVKMASGETGIIKGKSYSMYHIEVDGLGEIRSFDDRHVDRRI